MIRLTKTLGTLLVCIVKFQLFHCREELDQILITSIKNGAVVLNIVFLDICVSYSDSECLLRTFAKITELLAHEGNQFILLETFTDNWKHIVGCYLELCQTRKLNVTLAVLYQKMRILGIFLLIGDPNMGSAGSP